MNDGQEIPNRTAPIWYAVHGNHLHAYVEEAEARAHAAEFGGSYYSSFETISALRERKGLVQITLAAINLLTAENSLFKALAYGELRAAVLAHGSRLVADLESGALDGVTEPTKLAAMKAEVEEQKLIYKAEQNINKRVRVVARYSNEITNPQTPNLIGREFEIAAYNPVTDNVKIEVAGVEGEVTLTPDEYVFVEEDAPVSVAPTTDKLRD